MLKNEPLCVCLAMLTMRTIYPSGDCYNVALILHYRRQRPEQQRRTATQAIKSILMTLSDMDDEVFEFPVDGTLDLHTFLPREVKDLVADYVAECRRRSIYQIRIIHGKGTGALRRTVHGVLKRLPGVKSFSLAQDSGGGGWGATTVDLWPLEEESVD